MGTNLNTHFHLVLSSNLCANAPSLKGLISASTVGRENTALSPTTFFYLQSFLAADLKWSK
jgi:hypothetical protein